MESTQRLVKEKLGIFKIFKEAVKIPCKNPYFIIFTCLTSLPLFCSLFMYENLYLKTVIKAAKVVQEQEYPFEAFERLNVNVSHDFVILVITHLGILHFFDLFNTVATVSSASAIYAGDKSLTLKDMFIKHFSESRFKGPLITSIYALLLTSVISAGLLSLAVYGYMSIPYTLFMMLYAVMLVALLGKYLELSAVWNMGTLISILEEKEGDVALLVSAYLSKGNRRCGTLLMLFGLLWRHFLRLVWHYFVGWNGGGSDILITTVHVSLVCMANVMQWVAFVVYFNECKRVKSEKQVSIEEGQGMSV